MLTLEGTIRNVLTASYKEKKDQFTGEITPASVQHKVQIEYQMPQPNGDSKIIIDDFNLKCDDNLQAYVETYRKCIGKTVKVPVALWKIDGKAGLAIPKACLPIPVAQRAPAA